MKRYAILVPAILLAAGSVASSAQEARPAPAGTPAKAAEIGLKGTKIMVSDLQRSIAFYSSVLGLKVARSIAEDPAGPVNEAIMTQDGTFHLDAGTWLVLKVPGPGDPPLPQDTASWGQLVVTVPSSAPIAARAASAGYKVRHFQHNIVVISDPDGNGIEVLPTAVQ